MVYDSLDTIPCKVFFKIAETGDLSLLTTGKVDNEKLEKVWNRLEEEHQEKSANAKTKRIQSIFEKIVQLDEEYTIITSIIKYLWYERHQEFIDELKERGYVVNDEKYHESLNQIGKQASGLLVKIERLKTRLPKNDEEKEEINIDQSIYGYSSVAEIPISDTNTVTMSQYYAIKNLGEQRLDSMKKSSSKNK